MARLGPRIVVAGTHSGVGKTTIATGLMAALAARGLSVRGAKIGPDYLDPTFHALATDKAPRSLDSFLCGEALIPSLAACEEGELLVVEGVMGLFDGAGPTGSEHSSAAISRLLSAPVLLVVDAATLGTSIAALVHGFSTFDPAVKIAGLILNKVGGDAHGEVLRDALEPLRIPILGMLAQQDAPTTPPRAPGLARTAERANVARLGALIARSVDLEGVLALANAAVGLPAAPPPQPAVAGHVRVAWCDGPAFGFNYPENLQLLEAAGAELMAFDPLSATKLPEGCRGLYAGGGFAECRAAELADNVALAADLRRRTQEGLVIWAECGGLLWLSDTLGDRPMSGVLSGVHAEMTDQLTIGYRRATLCQPSFLGPVGTRLRGHELHYSTTTPAGDALELVGRFSRATSGWTGPRVFASYLHQHLSATPTLAERFVAAASDGPAGRARGSLS